MNRIKEFLLEFILIICLLFGLVLFVKPGASFFYKKSQIQNHTIMQLKIGYRTQFLINESIYDIDTILFSENHSFLRAAKSAEVKSGAAGSFAITAFDDRIMTIVFNPLTDSNPLESGSIYEIYFRPNFISRESGALTSSILILIILAIALVDSQNRKTVLSSPLGIVKIWLTGRAGETLIQFLKELPGKLLDILVLLAKKARDIDFLFSSILLPVAVLAVTCAIYALLSSQFLVQGVTYHFVNTLWKILVIMLGIIILAYIIVVKPKNITGFPHKRPREKLVAWDFILLLLPLTPIVQYMIINRVILTFTDILSISGIFIVFSSLCIIVIPELLGVYGSSRTLMMLGLAFSFTVTNMASLSYQNKWYEMGNFFIQSIVLLVIFLAARYIDKKIVSLFILLNFVTNSAFQAVTQKDVIDDEPSAASDNEKLLISLTKEKTPAFTPNIYLMVYDAYVPNETMQGYGIDNSAQEDFLVEQGFSLYPHTYSVGASTLSSMSRVLNASTSFYGYVRKGVSGDGIVQNSLKKLGYETWGIFPYDYMFRESKSSYDFSIPERRSKGYMTEGIFLGEFRYNLGFDDQTHEEFVAQKQSILENIPDRPLFVYMQTNSPAHSNRSGLCRPDETEQFITRLSKANIEMKQDINILIQNDPNAIIIVAGDHGPYLTKNCTGIVDGVDITDVSRLDLQDSFGSFLAIRWPTEDYVKYDEITVLQDLFPAIFAYLYQDVQILDAKVEPITLGSEASEAYVEDGIIHGGVNDGEPLYLSED